MLEIWGLSKLPKYPKQHEGILQLASLCLLFVGTHFLVTTSYEKRRRGRLT